MKRKILFLSILASFLINSLFSQNVWDLKRTVEYALGNNITVKQANLSSLQAELDYKQNRFGIYPTASFNNNWGFSFGRRENPTTGIFENTNSIYSSFGLNTSVSIFNFFPAGILLKLANINWKLIKLLKKKPEMIFRFV